MNAQDLLKVGISEALEDIKNIRNHDLRQQERLSIVLLNLLEAYSKIAQYSREEFKI